MTAEDCSIILFDGEAFHQPEDQRSLSLAGNAVEGSVELPPLTGLEEAPKHGLLVVRHRIEDDECCLVDVGTEPCDRDLKGPGEVDQLARRDPRRRPFVEGDGSLGIARERCKVPLREPACLAMTPEAGRDGTVGVCDAVRGVGHGAGISRRRWVGTRRAVVGRGPQAMNISFRRRLGVCDSSMDCSVQCGARNQMVQVAELAVVLGSERASTRGPLRPR